MLIDVIERELRNVRGFELPLAIVIHLEYIIHSHTRLFRLVNCRLVDNRVGYLVLGIDVSDLRFVGGHCSRADCGNKACGES